MMRKKMIAALIAALFTCEAMAFIPDAANDTHQIYVSTAAELKTALTNVRAGDEIILKSGVYEDAASSGKWRVFEAAASGTPDNHIIIRSEDPAHPAELCANQPEKKCVLYITGSYWEIRDLKIRNAAKGIFLAKSEHSIISDCEVSEIGDEAVHIIDDSSYNLVENCFIHDTGTVNAKYGEGVYIGSAKNATEYGFECHYNTVRGCRFGPNIAADHVDIKEFTIGNLVEYCTFDGTGIQGENGGNSFVEIKGNDAVIRYNTGHRNGCENQLYGFDLSQQLEGWGQNAKIYGNELYLDTADCFVVKGWNCSAEVFNNQVDPPECTCDGNRVMQVLAYKLRGDVNEDGIRNAEDAACMMQMLLTKEIPHISAQNADLNADGILNAADLTLLKQLLLRGDADEKAEISFAFVKEDAGKWRMTEGLSERSVTLTVAAEPDSELELAWGYWDPNAENGSGKWLMENLGKNPTDSSGNVQVTVKLPPDARRMALEVWSYTNASGKLDIDTVELVSAVTQAK